MMRKVLSVSVTIQVTIVVTIFAFLKGKYGGIVTAFTPNHSNRHLACFQNDQLLHPNNAIASKWAKPTFATATCSNQRRIDGRRRRRTTTTTTRGAGVFPLYVSTTTAMMDIPMIITTMTEGQAEEWAGPLFGGSLFPYLAFLYFLSREENDCPKGVTVGFATLLLFVFLTIPAAITAKIQYGVSLADCDWLHGSAESLLTITNLIIVIAFRQALNAKEQMISTTTTTATNTDTLEGTTTTTIMMPDTATKYAPMVLLSSILIVLAGITALLPASMGAEVHTPYLNGVLDIPSTFQDAFLGSLGAQPEPDNALTVACWIIHISSLVEFLVAMGFAWRWADIVKNPKWKGLTWGLLPLHSSGITACTYHLFYNRIPFLVPLQALLTCIGNSTAAYAAYRIAQSNGWKFVPPFFVSSFDNNKKEKEQKQELQSSPTTTTTTMTTTPTTTTIINESESLVGFEDLADALKGDTDYSFVTKLFVGCAIASYGVKYGETFFSFPYDANVFLGIAIIVIPSCLNAYKWYQRGLDPTFEGWF